MIVNPQSEVITEITGKTQRFPQIECFFVGGVGDEVTGSCTLLKIMTSDGKSEYMAVDAGAVQGTQEYRNDVFPVQPKEIRAVFETHGHFDHSGLLPLLYKKGFRGTIYTSDVTKRVLTPMLYDGAKICEKKVVSAEFEPLYTEEHVEKVLELVKSVEVGRYIDISENVKVRFMPTTHQNGACRVEIHVTDPNGENYAMAFSGDIGPSNSLLYRQKLPYTSKKIDCLVLEVLHGVKEPEETLNTSIKRLKEIIQKAIRQKKHVVLAGFSLDRNAMLVYLLNEFRKQGVKVEMAVDSPLTMAQLEIYRYTYLTSRYWFKDLGEDPFDTRNFKIVRGRERSFYVNHGEAPRVVVTASATGNGGPITQYFEAGIQRSDYVFVFCGWSAPDSPSSLLHNARNGEKVELPGGTYTKYCKTYRLHGCSSHGYFPEVVEAITDYPKCKTLVFNHARNDDRRAAQEKTSEFFDGDIVMPEYYDAYIFSKAGVTPVEHEDALSDFEHVIDKSIVQVEYEKLFANGNDDDDFVEGELFP